MPTVYTSKIRMSILKIQILLILQKDREWTTDQRGFSRGDEKPFDYDDYPGTMSPEEIESGHPHYTISWCNNWMLRQAEYVVTYIMHTWGGAA